MRNGWHVGVVIPAKNEEDFISKVITTLPNFVDRIVVVDDGSSDMTAQIVNKHSTELKNLELIQIPVSYTHLTLPTNDRV